MDYYKFINSKDIREYLKEIKYEFSPLEKAYIVYRSNLFTLGEKFDAFQAIIDNDEDCRIKKRFNCKYYPNLKEFLKNYMELSKRLIDRFYKDEKKCAYEAELLSKGDNDFYKSDFVGSSYSTVKSFLNNDLKNDDIKVIKIRKVFLNKYRNYIEVIFNDKYEVVDFQYSLKGFFNQKEEDILMAFEGMWFDIPTPFKKGDLLIFAKRPYWVDPFTFGDDGTPFVLRYLSTWSYKKYLEDGFLDNEPYTKEGWNRILNIHRKNGDVTDMCVSAYFCSKGYFFPESEGSYLDLEYYQENLEGQARIMLALSKYIKGEIDLYGLQKAIQVIRLQESAKDELSCFHYTDEELEKLKLLK